MKFVIFGLTVSSSWGNGHATLWRGLIAALTAQGHAVSFFERDVSYYAENRDLYRLPDGAELLIYPDWPSVKDDAAAAIAGADVAIVTSYCPDAVSASDLIFQRAPGLAVFYDLDTPVTLARLASGERVAYLPPQGLGDFDLVLSYTGGAALTALRERLGARRVAPLYGHVDPARHRPAPPAAAFRGDLSYLGTYAADRQPALQSLFVEPVRQRPDLRFVLGGAGYPDSFPWTDNIYFVQHLPPPDHPAFFSSAPLTLNVTRADMAAMGYCPSGRLFEAAACGAAIISDRWAGLETFFQPGTEILLADDAEDVLAALDMPRGDIAAIAQAGRARVLDEHSSARRAEELVALVADLPGIEASPHQAAGEAMAEGGPACGV